MKRVHAVPERLVAVFLEQGMPVLDRDLPREQEGAVEVDRDHGLEVFERLLGDTGVARDSGHVHDAVDAARRRERIRHHALDVALARDVRGHRQRLRRSGGRDLVPHVGEAPPVQVDQGHLGAVGGQRRGDPVADPLAGPGHDVGLPLERPVAQHELHLASQQPIAGRRSPAGGGI